MCGIAGWLGRMDQPDLAAIQMTDALRHRGPDRQEHRHWKNAALVHTRLSILDLSETGSQPMSNEDKSVWVVFHGEIYNHGEHRLTLTSKGHRFRGHSDTEVLPHLFE